MTWRWTLTACALCLGACADLPEPGLSLEAYRAVLTGRIDPGLTPEDYAPPALAYPDRSQRRAVVPETSVGLRTFWSLGTCDLRLAVARRNTALGRAESAFLGLPYEHQLAAALDTCLNAAGADEFSESERATLQALRRQKQADLGAVFWNATFGSPEFATLFSPSAPWLDAAELAQPPPVAALRDLIDLEARFGRTGPPMSRDALLGSFEFLERSRYAGRLLKTLHVATFYLDDVNGLLSSLGPGANCLDAAAAPPLSGLVQIHDTRFAGDLDGYLDTLHGHAGPWLAALADLAHVQLEFMPAGFADFHRVFVDVEAAESQWQRFLEARRAHAYWWAGAGCPATLLTPAAPSGRQS